MMDIKFILNTFDGLVIVDEAYINFSRQKTVISELTGYSNLLVIQTLSKAWGLAALRIGLGFASLNIIELFNKVKPPYNINEASQLLSLDALEGHMQVNKWIRDTVVERAKLSQELTKIVVRNRSKELLCENCLRITVGTPDENKLLIETLNQFKR